MTTSPESQRNFALAIIAAGLICNPFVLGWIFSPSGAISSPSWITVISLLDLGGIIGGVRLYRARPAPPMKRIVFSIAVIALIGCSVEVGLHIIRWISHPYEFERTNRRVSLPQYRDKGWAKELFREDGRLDIGVAPYIGWRTREMHGKYINVGPDGIRRTLDFPHPPGQTPDSLFLFGGSSMWGTYVRDERTIPSGLSRFFHDRGINIVAVNYGERGFVFMQNVVHLMLLLRDGSRPNHVVFYEGANDLITPYMLGRTGVPGLQPQLEDLLARRKEPIQKQLALAAKDFVEQRVFLFGAFDQLMRVAFADGQPPGADDARLRALRDGICADFRASAALADSLSRQYGFDYDVVLQPLLFMKPRVAPEERNLDAQSSDPRLKELSLETYAGINALGLPHVHDFSHIFDAVGEPIFSDFCHVSEEGNEIIAAGLVPLVK